MPIPRERDLGLPIQPAALGLRVLAVGGTIVLVMSLLLAGLAVAKGLGIDPNRLQGSGFDPAPLPLALFLCYQALQVAVVLLAHRYLHGGRIHALGFGRPVFRMLLVGFALGVLITGTFYVGGTFLSWLVAGSDVSVTWAVPANVSAVTVTGYFLVYLVMFLSVNSFAEELVYRCYPIEQFRDRPHLQVWAAMGAATLFAGAHFIIGAFDPFRMVGLFAFALLCAFLYVGHRSIWLLVGLHNGTGFVSYSVSGNWKLGGLVELSVSSPSAVAFFGSLLIVYSVAIWLVLRHNRARRPARSAGPDA